MTRSLTLMRSRRALVAAVAALAVGSVLVAAVPSVAVTGTRPAVIVLCNFKDETQRPKPVSYYLDMFSDQGAGQLGAFDYWRDVSYGNLSVSGTVVKGWYTLDMTRDQWVASDRNSKWRVCADAAQPDVDYSKYAGVVTVFPNAYSTLTSDISATATSINVASTTTGAGANFPTVPFDLVLVGAGLGGACVTGAKPAQYGYCETVKVTAINGTTLTVERGQNGSTAAPFLAGNVASVGNELFGFNPRAETLGGTAYTLGGEVMMHDQALTLALHEEGHLFGLYAPAGGGNHSRAISTAPGDYSDCYDLGSALSCVYTFVGVLAGTPFGGESGIEKGPGLNSIQIDDQGWLADSRKATFNNSTCSQSTYTMAALNHPSTPGIQQLRLPGPISITAGQGGTVAGDYYTLELRSKSAWDRGIPADAFVLHVKGTDNRSYLVDQDDLGVPVGNLGDGALRAGRIYVDPDAKVYIAVNSIDPASFTGVVTVGGCRINAALSYSGDTTAVYHRQATLAGDLVVSGTTTPVPGVDVNFTLGTQSCKGTTDSKGHASCTLRVEQPSGAYTVGAAFAGNAAYNPANGSGSFTVQRAPTTLSYTGPTVILQGAKGVTLSAVLLEDGAVPTPPVPSGQTVTLGLGAQTCTGTVSSTGAVSCSLVFAGGLGSAALSAAFAGDAYYLPSADTGKTATVFAFPPRGAFVLGDTSVATAGSTQSLSWWSDAWWSLNKVSGGTAPLSFKGFAGTITTLPTSSPVTTCGSTFVTLPGNSPPPTAEVPSYMGVLVASSVTKAGSGISGTWRKIVVVKVDPGYAPTPGHPGTGNIVATFC